MRKANFITALILALLAAFSCGIRLWIDYGLWAIACYAAIILALPCASLMHELGHMLFGAICKIKAVPKFSVFGSSCVKLIPKTDKRLRLRLFLTASGGVYVNLIMMVISSLPIYYNAIPAWLCVFLPSSAYLFLLNIWSAEKTDGKIRNDVLANNDEAKVMLAVLTVQAQVLNGKPIEEVDEALLFNLPVIREDEESFIALTELRLEYCVAKGMVEEAKKYAARLEDLKEYVN